MQEWWLQVVVEQRKKIEDVLLVKIFKKVEVFLVIFQKKFLFEMYRCQVRGLGLIYKVVFGDKYFWKNVIGNVDIDIIGILEKKMLSEVVCVCNFYYCVGERNFYINCYYRIGDLFIILLQSIRMIL